MIRRPWWNGALALLAATVAVFASSGSAPLSAAPLNPMVFKTQFEEAKKRAEVVASVRVLSATCTGTEAGGGKVSAVTLQVSLQVLDVEKGPVKKSDVLVVSHKVTLPAGAGPRAYGYTAALHRFPFTPGVGGSVALKWDNDTRRYVALAGWVPTPNGAAIPTEVGKAFVAGDAPKRK